MIRIIDENGPLPEQQGSYLVRSIPIDWLYQAALNGRVYLRDGHCHTVRFYSPDRVITTPGRLHRDIDSDTPLEQVLEQHAQFNILVKGSFPFIEKDVKPSSLSSIFAGVVAKRTRPWFQRQHEKKAINANYGGRSQTFLSGGHLDLVEYDIPTCYPSIAMGELPIDTPYRVRRDAAPEPGKIDIVKIDCVLQDDLPLLPTRSGHKRIDWLREGRFVGWYFWPEVCAALENCETVRNFRVLERLRVRSGYPLQRTIEELVRLRYKHPEHEKSFKQVANRIVGTFASRGANDILYFPEHNDDIQVGDFLVSPELDLWGRRVSSKKPPHTYRPLLCGYVWSQARIKVMEALATTRKPVSVHIDGIIAERQATPPTHTRLKKEWGLTRFECPWNGALFVFDEDNRIRVKAPGRKKED